jgi:magnesium-transporting ATPase (P-type)
MSSALVVAAPARGPDPEESVDALLRDLGAGLDGLDAREAERRLGQYGPNEIRRPERQSHARRLARQFVDPLALLLWMAVGFRCSRARCRSR